MCPQNTVSWSPRKDFCGEKALENNCNGILPFKHKDVIEWVNRLPYSFANLGGYPKNKHLHKYSGCIPAVTLTFGIIHVKFCSGHRAAPPVPVCELV